MKTKILFLAALFSAILATAQSPSTTPPMPSPGNATGGFGRTNQLRLGNFGTTLITNSQGQVYSPDQIESQLVDLRTAVNQVIPALNAITEVYSNSTAGTQGGVVGGIAGVLGGVLDRNTNNATTGSSTNTLGRILRDAISAATTNTTTTNFAQLQDFVTLQSHLQAMNPVFDRLGVSSNTVSSAFGGTDTNSPFSTGKGKGPGRDSNKNNNNNEDQK